MTDEATQRALDAEEHRRTYVAIMKFTGEFGVPFTMALGVFFTNLVLGNGWLSVFAGILTYVIVYFVVKTFFSH